MTHFTAKLGASGEAPANLRLRIQFWHLMAFYREGAESFREISRLCDPSSSQDSVELPAFESVATISNLKDRLSVSFTQLLGVESAELFSSKKPNKPLVPTEMAFILDQENRRWLSELLSEFEFEDLRLCEAIRARRAPGSLRLRSQST